MENELDTRADARGAGTDSRTAPSDVAGSVGSPTPHSPLPWYCSPGAYPFDIFSGNGIAAVGQPTFTPRGIANAEFIVRAVNSHDALLAALRKLTAAEDASIDAFATKEIEAIESAMRDARAAIALAEGNR